MLASITPLGERGRHRTYAVTMGAFLLGAVAGGAGLGALLGALGSVLVGAVAPGARLVVLAVAIGLALVVDRRPGAAPGPRRQVDERWLDRYRGWVYGLGFGVQLGVGISTVVTSAATYAALLGALLSAGVGSGAIVLGVYGAVRGLTPLLAVRVRRPEQLVALHGHLLRVARPVERAGQCALAATALLCLVAVAS